MSHPDLLVAGGGPAGLAVALGARRAGLSVRVVERRHPPLDKPCGEGLMPDGAACLQRLGVDLGAVPHRPFRGIRWIDGELIAEGRFPAGPGLGIRRLALHRALAAAAEAAGVEILWGTRVLGLAGSPREPRLETAAGVLRGGFLVAADGLRSPLRRQLGLAGPPARRRRFGVRRHLRLEPWSDCVEVYWGPGLEAYVTPVGSDEVGVALLWSGRKARFDDLLQGLPDLARRLQGARAVSRDLGIGPLEQRVRGVLQGKVALVGDASGYLDAITGEGLSLAFHQAEALVESLVHDDLPAYARAHRRLSRLPDRVTRAVLLLASRPRLRRRVLSALAEDPALFARLLAVHARSAPVRSVGLAGAARLARKVLHPSAWGASKA